MFAQPDFSSHRNFEAMIARYAAEPCERTASAILDDVFARFGFAAVARAMQRLGAGSSINRDDALDIQGEVYLNLVGRLRQLRDRKGREIASLQGYADMMAKNAMRTSHAKARPLRAKLAANLRYAVTSASDLALWQSASQRAVVGYGEWRGQGKGLDSPSLRSLVSRPSELAATLHPGETFADLDLRTLTRRLLDHLGHPLKLTDAVAILAGALGADEPTVSLQTTNDESTCLQENIADSRADAQVSAEQREALAALWEAMRDLPIVQRAALLLNLRDHLGRGVIGLLPETGLVTRTQIAHAVGLSQHELDALWDQLPMEDAQIALRYGLKATQVVGLRRTARARLARTLEAA